MESTVKVWVEAAWAYTKAYASIFKWFLLLPSGVFVLVLIVLGVFGDIDQKSSIALIRSNLPWIIGISGFLAGLFVSIKDRHALAEITRPRIKIEYHGTDFRMQDSRATGVFSYVKLIGLCHNPVNFEVYCSAAVSTKRGSQNLHLHVGKGTHRVLSRTEQHILPVLLYEFSGIPAPMMRCLVAANHIHADEIERGDEFIVTISAFGEMEPAHIQLRCWTRDQKFNVEEVRPAVLTSN